MEIIPSFSSSSGPHTTVSTLAGDRAMDDSSLSTPNGICSSTRNGSGKRSDQRSAQRLPGRSMNGSRDPFALDGKPTRKSQINGTSTKFIGCCLICILGVYMLSVLVLNRSVGK